MSQASAYLLHFVDAFAVFIATIVCGAFSVAVGVEVWTGSVASAGGVGVKVGGKTSSVRVGAGVRVGECVAVGAARAFFVAALTAVFPCPWQPARMPARRRTTTINSEIRQADLRKAIRYSFY